jgi:hypothetical protein
MVLKLDELRRIAAYGAARPWHDCVARAEDGSVKPLGDGSPVGESFGQASAFRDALVRIGEALDAKLVEIEADGDLTATDHSDGADALQEIETLADQIGRDVYAIAVAQAPPAPTPRAPCSIQFSDGRRLDPANGAII